MKLLKIKTALILTLTILITFGHSAETKAMDGRVKALGTMALYGTVGGALLGTASMAFGTSSRAIAQGASLGLYAGIIFGTYVVVSHSMKQKRYENPEPPQRPDNYYPDDSTSPYQGGQDSTNSWGSYNRVVEMSELSADFGLDMKSLDRLGKKKGAERPPVFFNFFNYQF
jgi:hypothetical protein